MAVFFLRAQTPSLTLPLKGEGTPFVEMRAVLSPLPAGERDRERGSRQERASRRRFAP